MGNETIQPEGWRRPRGYANGVRVPAGRDLVLVAGMIGWDAQERIVSDDFVAQFEQALRNVLAVVEAGGGRAEDLVGMTIFVTGIDEYRTRANEVGEAWRRVLGRVYPAMALVEVAALVEPRARVEIEALAAVGPNAASPSPE